MNELTTTLKQAARMPAIRRYDRVRLRGHPEQTGFVTGPGSQIGEVRVRWDADDTVTHIGMHRLDRLPQTYREKEAAVIAAIEDGVPYKVICYDHDITMRTITNWIKRFGLKGRYNVNRPSA
jgi:hypothetical protein